MKRYLVIYKDSRNREVRRETVEKYDWEIMEYAFKNTRSVGLKAEIYPR